jgi:hypothetical protein
MSIFDFINMARGQLAQQQQRETAAQVASNTMGPLGRRIADAVTGQVSTPPIAPSTPMTFNAPQPLNLTPAPAQQQQGGGMGAGGSALLKMFGLGG